MSAGVVIVAAGRGTRAGGDVPKQYRLLAGVPVLARTLAVFLEHDAITRVVIVIHPDDHEACTAVLASSFLADLKTGAIPISLVNGASSRQGSVLAGLESLSEDPPEGVLIHDAARPFVDRPLIDRVLAGFAADTGMAHEHAVAGVLPALPVADTLKRAGTQSAVAGTVSRDGLFAAQTPQAFHFNSILAAHRAAKANAMDQEFTDDVAVAEWAGLKIRIVEGSPDNNKLTSARDLQMADERLSVNNLATTPLPDIRTGNGYDVHRLVPGDGVTLCGVFIAGPMRLDGHSDADVGLHALTDALLATCGAGDIGDHFPPDDAQWKNAASRVFLAHAAGVVRSKGGTILNVDVSLIAEAPKIAPHRLAMRQAMADTLDLALERCSVKATTNETIGFVGRREGIAAIATASVAYRQG